MALFEVRGLSRRPWFEGFDLTLEAGEVAVLRGPTGSGKTLLLRALADLDPRDGGEARLDGVPQDAVAAPDWRRRVLYLFPTPARFGGTVGEDLERFADLVERPAPSPRWLDPAASVEHLSSGESQLLALERAFLLAPRVLLLDEATAGLDPNTAAEAEGAVLDYAAAGRAVLWVSHDDGLAGRLGVRTEAFP